jgi:hypothetical protein
MSEKALNDFETIPETVNRQCCLQFRPLYEDRQISKERERLDMVLLTGIILPNGRLIQIGEVVGMNIGR